MPQTRRPTRLAAAALALLLLLGACSGSSSNDDVASEGTEGDTSGDTTTSVAPAAEPAAEPVASAGCETPEAGAAEAGVEQEQLLTVEGAERRYLVTTPSAHDGEMPLPVVLDFHGLMEGAEIHAGMSAYSDVAEEEGFVAVFPHGTGEPLRWDAETTSDPNLDLLYVDAMLEQLGSDLCIDRSRIYATGLSYGAMFTTLLLCTRADVLAAAAPVAGLQDPPECTPSRPVPIVTYHGTVDPILQFDGGVDVSAIPGFAPEGAGPTTTQPPADLDGPGYPANVAAWAARNGCDAEPTDEELTPEVIHRVYDCPEGADVEFYIIVGGGHSWPSSEFSKSIAEIVGHTTFDIDATRDSWAFLSQFRNDTVS